MWLLLLLLRWEGKTRSSKAACLKREGGHVWKGGAETVLARKRWNDARRRRRREEGRTRMK